MRLRNMSRQNEASIARHRALVERLSNINPDVRDARPPRPAFPSFLPFFARKRAPMDTAPATMSARSTIEPDRVRRRVVRTRRAALVGAEQPLQLPVNRIVVAHKFHGR